MTNHRSICVILFLLVLSLCHFPVSADDKLLTAAEFTLKDQFGTEFSYKFPRQKISILAFGDQDGAEQLEAWLRPIIEKYEDKIEIQGVAELSAVPGIAKGIVRNAIKKRSKNPIMLDWSGDVSKSYKTKKNVANVYLIDAQGKVIAQESDAADDKKLAALYKKIDDLLK